MSWIIQENITGYSIKEEIKNCTRQDSLVCTINKSGYLKKDALKNAHLIAAAPELLTAVEDFLSFLKSDYQGTNNKDLSGGMIRHIENLIQKAKGQP